MVLYITTWQEAPDDNQEDTMTTKPEWFTEFENKQNEFNQQILSLVQSIAKRIDNLVVKNNLKE